jgi:LysR family transcriptional regulator, glycine cleavage system transcriptional activator
MFKLPPLVELRAFEAAARHLSFKSAAHELFITPTAISHQIRLLEQHCGQPLFRRRPLALTWAGEALFAVVHDGLQRFSDTLGNLREGVAAGRLRVTATNAFAALWIVPRLPLWRKSFPRLRLDLVGTDSVLNLKAGEADVAIRYAATPPIDGDWVKLARDRYCIVGSPRLVNAAALPLSPSALIAFPLIECEWAPTAVAAPVWRHWEAAAQKLHQGLPPIARLVSLSFREESHGIQAAIAGQGIAICSDVLVGSELANGTLLRLSDITLPGFEFYAVRRAGHPREREIKRFVDWMREQFDVATS